MYETCLQERAYNPEEAPVPRGAVPLGAGPLGAGPLGAGTPGGAPEGTCPGTEFPGTDTEELGTGITGMVDPSTGTDP